ncbi:MAG: ABC transporter permease subunit [Chloroflexi bacterium]|nr:ABC transporter permease subunit [Chloroflexota bacterium]
MRRTRSVRARRWAHENLFSDASNTALTVVTALALTAGVLLLARFVFATADWTVIETNRRLITIGRYPAGEEWRLWPPLWALLGVGGLSFGLWIPLGVRGYAVAAGVTAFLYLLLLEGDTAALFGVGVVLAVVGYAGTRAWVVGSRAESRARLAAVVGMALLLPLVVLMLQLGEGVRTSLWSGFLLNVTLATVGIALGFPLGVGLALGRASSYPVIRWTATAYIEVVRAGPLVAWLFMARFVLPDFLPPMAGLDELDIVARAMLVLAGFTGAYVAEVVRGGLQSLPRGQLEAAQAVGLNALQTTWLIVLPQALRAVIPALVSQFISLWKDTTLVFALGLIELLGAGEATLSQTDFIGREKEVLAFVALAFWAIAFGMSRLSLRVERTLGVGTS